MIVRIEKVSHHRCGAENRQESSEEYMRTLEVMNQTNERIDKRTDNLGDLQRVDNGVASRVTNRAYNGEWGRLGLLRALFLDCLLEVSFEPLGGTIVSARKIPGGSVSGTWAGMGLASASLIQQMGQEDATYRTCYRKHTDSWRVTLVLFGNPKTRRRSQIPPLRPKQNSTNQGVYYTLSIH